MAIIGVKVLLVDEQIHKGVIGSLQNGVQALLDPLGAVRVEHDVVLDEDDVLLGVDPEISCSRMACLFGVQVVGYLRVALLVKDKVGIQCRKPEITEGTGAGQRRICPVLRGEAVGHLAARKACKLLGHQLPLVHHLLVAGVFIGTVGLIGKSVKGETKPVCIGTELLFVFVGEHGEVEAAVHGLVVDVHVYVRAKGLVQITVGGKKGVIKERDEAILVLPDVFEAQNDVVHAQRIGAVSALKPKEKNAYFLPRFGTFCHDLVAIMGKRYRHGEKGRLRFLGLHAVHEDTAARGGTQGDGRRQKAVLQGAVDALEEHVAVLDG